MKPRFARASTIAFFLFMAAQPAAAQLVVVGDTGAAACYRAARDGQDDREALAICTRGIIEGASQRDIGATYVNRAIIHIHRKEFDAALQDVEDSFEHRDFAEAYATRAVAYYHMDRLQDSIDQNNLALAREDLDEPAKVYYNRALTYEKMERIEEAYYDYKKASELDPGWDLPQEELTRFIVLPAEESAAAS
jgi:tetratricopeptide (TPR) repeat protein